MQGEVEIFINRDYTVIRVADKLSGEDIVEVKLTPDQLSMALARFGNTPCEITRLTQSLDHMGKAREHLWHEFEIPNGTTYKERKEVARRTYEANPVNGWIPSHYYGSQDSFKVKDGKEFACMMLYRFVEPTPTEAAQ
jgi:hypothetical protein